MPNQQTAMPAAPGGGNMPNQQMMGGAPHGYGNQYPGGGNFNQQMGRGMNQQ